MSHGTEPLLDWTSRWFVPVLQAEGDQYRSLRPQISPYDGILTFTAEATGSSTETTVITIDNIPVNKKVVIERILVSCDEATLVRVKYTYGATPTTETAFVAELDAGFKDLDLTKTPIVIYEDGLQNVQITVQQGTGSPVQITVFVRFISL